MESALRMDNFNFIFLTILSTGCVCDAFTGVISHESLQSGKRILVRADPDFSTVIAIDYGTTSICNNCSKLLVQGKVGTQTVTKNICPEPGKDNYNRQIMKHIIQGDKGVHVSTAACSTIPYDARFTTFIGWNCNALQFNASSGLVFYDSQLLYHVPDNTCSWSIIGKAGEAVSLRILFVDLGPTRQICWYTYLRIYDGNTDEAERIMEICGTGHDIEYPIIARSTQRYMFIKIGKPISTEDRKILVAFYDTVPSLVISNETVGYLDSEENMTNAQDNCKWTFQAPTHSHVFLQFHQFYISCNASIEPLPFSVIDPKVGRVDVCQGEDYIVLGKVLSTSNIIVIEWNTIQEFVIERFHLSYSLATDPSKDDLVEGTISVNMTCNMIEAEGDLEEEEEDLRDVIKQNEEKNHDNRKPEQAVAVAEQRSSARSVFSSSIIGDILLAGYAISVATV